MKIYKDILTGDELFSDSYDVIDMKNGLYKVIGKIVSQNSEVQNLDSLIGGNKSEEAPEEDLVTSESKTGINIVMDYRLQEGPKYESKKDLLAALKSYFKRMSEKLPIPPDVQKEMALGAQYLKKTFDNLEYFLGESYNPDGAMIFCDYEEDGITPFFLFFKHGVMEEKV